MRRDCYVAVMRMSRSVGRSLCNQLLYITSEEDDRQMDAASLAVLGTHFTWTICPMARSGAVDWCADGVCWTGSRLYCGCLRVDFLVGHMLST